MVQITKFTILGERCSGTNFLEEAITTNFDITYTAEHGHKHYFCFQNYTNKYIEDTLFIGIIRNPIYWMNSFSKELHHIPKVNKPLTNFLFNKFYSVYDNVKSKNGGEVVHKEDLNYNTGKEYKNIFELRKLKNFYLKNIVKTKVPNYILINYEDLLYNYCDTLTKIKNEFALQQKHDTFLKITKYKKTSTYNFKQQRQITLSLKTIKLIWSNLDVKQENSLGYHIFDNNTFFKNKNKVETEETEETECQAS